MSRARNKLISKSHDSDIITSENFCRTWTRCLFLSHLFIIRELESKKVRLFLFYALLLCKLFASFSRDRFWALKRLKYSHKIPAKHVYWWYLFKCDKPSDRFNCTLKFNHVLVSRAEWKDFLCTIICPEKNINKIIAQMWCKFSYHIKALRDIPYFCYKRKAQTNYTKGFYYANFINDKAKRVDRMTHRSAIIDIFRLSAHSRHRCLLIAIFAANNVTNKISLRWTIRSINRASTLRGRVSIRSRVWFAHEKTHCRYTRVTSRRQFFFCTFAAKTRGVSRDNVILSFFVIIDNEFLRKHWREFRSLFFHVLRPVKACNNSHRNVDALCENVFQKINKILTLKIHWKAHSLFFTIRLFSVSEGRSSLCVGCGGRIHDQWILRVAPNLEWHAACLKCAECQQFLDEKCTCFVRDGKTYCKRDYVRWVKSMCFSRVRELFSRKVGRENLLLYEMTQL